MQLNALLERLNQLQSQARWPESRELLESYLADHPDDPIAQLYYINTVLNMGEKLLAPRLGRTNASRAARQPLGTAPGGGN